MFAAGSPDHVLRKEYHPQGALPSDVNPPTYDYQTLSEYRDDSDLKNYNDYYFIITDLIIQLDCGHTGAESSVQCTASSQASQLISLALNSPLDLFL